MILTLACPDRRVFVHAVSGLIAELRGNILDSQQFGDPTSGSFLMRVHFAAEDDAGYQEWRNAVSRLAAELDMTYQLYDLSRPVRILILVSRLGHCLNDLLYRWRAGALPAVIAGVGSSRDDHAALCRMYGVAYHRLPGPDASTEERDAALLELTAASDAELVVLARYMQVLGPRACAELTGRAINIHHSFLPSFKGAEPYRQAYERGVKLIGATAHYVTDELDEGPIIEQEVARVDHAHSPTELARVGRDLESVALARAVRWHVERRVLILGQRTVVFR
jgi:formyltetrahydrofolate deformylase